MSDISDKIMRDIVVDIGNWATSGVHVTMISRYLMSTGAACVREWLPKTESIKGDFLGLIGYINQSKTKNIPEYPAFTFRSHLEYVDCTSLTSYTSFEYL